MVTLVLGGARSGKSAHAEGLVTDADVTDVTDVTYVATARVDPTDAEWQARIAAHVARRPPTWRTVEPADLAAFLPTAAGPTLVDDIATWLTAVMDDHNAWDGALDGVRKECDRLVAAVAGCPAELVLVSAEVGLGVVPATRSGRLFRDQLGALNADLAQVSAQVVLLVAGIPLRLR